MNNKFSLNPFYSACKQRWDTLERSEAFLLTCYKTVTLCYSWYIRVNPVTPQSGQHQHFMVKQSVFFFIVSLLPWGGQGLGISGISFNTYNWLPAIPHMWNNIDRISANTNQRCLCSYRHVCANPWTNKSQILLMSSVIFWLKWTIALYCYVYKCLYVFAACLKIIFHLF